MIARFSILIASVLISASIAAADTVVYNNIASPLAPNIVSEGYEANSIGELGDLIQFSGAQSSYTLTSATVIMSNWSYASEFSQNFNGNTITASGYLVSLTLNIYSVGADYSVGTLLESNTQDALIPWRPEPSAGCTSSIFAPWMASSGKCYNGAASTVIFNLAGVTVPQEVIYSIAFSTTDDGVNPTGVPGPYDSLNLGLSETAPSVGSNPLPDTAYIGNDSPITQQMGWAPYSGAIEFEAAATPEPSTWLLLGSGIFCLAALVLRNAKQIPTVMKTRFHTRR